MAETSLFPVARKAPPPKRNWRRIAGLAVLGAVLFAGGSVYNFARHRAALKAAWTIAGPACPAAVHTWREVAAHRAPHHFRYGGAEFGYLFGGSDCVSIPHGGPFSREPDFVCQFTAPTMISVVQPDGGASLFELGKDRRATVTLSGGRTRCVLGGWLRD